MRLSRLDLTRYGKFTDHHIDFGPLETGVADLHIVYGPNEAGKSTALAAYLDILYGIENRSSYNFIHPYPSMEIGAALEIDAALHQVVRLKRAKHSLVDADGQPISENLFQGVLVGMDRQAYSTLYSLDDETIEAGGESILASDGNLGELLYAATAGIADLSQQLSELHSVSDQFFKARSKKDELTALKNKLSELSEQRSELDTLALDYHRLVESRDTVKAEYDKTGSELAEAKCRIEEIQSLLRARPRLLDLQAIREELNPLLNLPPAPPANWSDELPLLRDKGSDLTGRADALAKEITQLETEISSSARDEVALAQLSRLHQLDSLRARHNNAAEDLPERQAELAGAENEIDRILHLLGLNSEIEPSDLLLPAFTSGALQAHAKIFTTVESTLQSTRREYMLAEQNWENEKARLVKAVGGVGSEPVAQLSTQSALTLLRTAVNEVRSTDASVRASVLDKSRVNLQAEFDTALLKLQPWSGDVEQLIAMQVPAMGDIHAWKTAMEQAHSTLSERQQFCERLETELLESEAEIRAITTSSGMVTEQDTMSIRSERDHAWALHKEQLDRQSADKFEQLLFKNDAITTARIIHSSDLARLTESMRTLELVKAKVARARDLVKEAANELQSVNDKVSSSIRALKASLPDNLTLFNFENWLRSREDLLGKAKAKADAERDLVAAHKEIESCRKKLIKAFSPFANVLTPVDSDGDLETLLAVAQQLIEQETELSSLRATVEESERSLEHRRNEQLLAEKAESDWQSKWQELCSASWFGQTDETPGVETVQEIMLHTTRLATALGEQKRIQSELHKFENYQSTYEQEVRSFATDLGMVIDKISVQDLDREIQLRIEQAVNTQQRQLETQERLEQIRITAADLKRQLDANAARTLEMNQYLGVDTIIEAEQRLQSIKARQSLLPREQSITRELLETLQVRTVEEAQAALEAINLADLNQELSALQNVCSSLDVRSRELYSNYVKAVDSIDEVGGDETVAKIEEQRQTILLEIKERALQYVKHKAGIMATERALRMYRDRHQSSMMSQASAVFKTISRGNYTKLTTRTDKDTDILIGVTSDGGSKLSTEMSKGTRFQLYLALRVAGYFEYARSRTPVPFIADDIMETFDDERAIETFGVFADMAMKGQVIYLTHHQHLCEIAKSVCPAVKIHSV